MGAGGDGDEDEAGARSGSAEVNSAQSSSYGECTGADGAAMEAGTGWKARLLARDTGVPVAEENSEKRLPGSGLAAGSKGWRRARAGDGDAV